MHELEKAVCSNSYQHLSDIVDNCVTAFSKEKLKEVKKQNLTNLVRVLSYVGIGCFGGMALMALPASIYVGFRSWEYFMPPAKQNISNFLSGFSILIMALQYHSSAISVIFLCSSFVALAIEGCARSISFLSKIDNDYLHYLPNCFTELISCNFVGSSEKGV